MNQNLREQALQLLDLANNKGADKRPSSCPACGLMMALPKSSTQFVPDTVR
jgi:hypothetical protein